MSSWRTSQLSVLGGLAVLVVGCGVETAQAPAGSRGGGAPDGGGAGHGGMSAGGGDGLGGVATGGEGGTAVGGVACNSLFAAALADRHDLDSCDMGTVPGGALCGGLSPNACAEHIALDPPAPAMGQGDFVAAYVWLCPDGGTDCAASERALCADGTRPSAYVAAADPPSSDWLVYMSGGGGCIGDHCGETYESGERLEMTTCHGGGTCLEEARADFTSHVDKGGILSDAASNPFGSYNRVFMRKCSYDDYRGDADEQGITTPTGRTAAVYHHGHRVLKHLFAQVAAGDLAAGLPTLTEANHVVLVGNSGGGKTLIYTGDELRRFLTDSAGPVAMAGTVRLVIDAHLLPSIEQEALLNPSHTPAVPPNAQTVYQVPWGGSGTLTSSAGEAAYDTSTYEPGPRPGRVWEYDQLWGVPLDVSCEAVHGPDAPACHDELHVLFNHVSTPFFVRMDMLDNVWADGPAIFSEDEFDFDDDDFAARVNGQAVSLVEGFSTESELATGVDQSGSLGDDPNDLKPSAWQLGLFVPRCGVAGSHTPLVKDTLYRNMTMTRCGPQGCVDVVDGDAIAAWVGQGAGIAAVDGFMASPGVVWSTGCP